MTESKLEMMARCIAELWIRDGVTGLSYGTVAEFTEKSTGNVSYYFKSMDDLIEAGADYLVANHDTLSDLPDGAVGLDAIAATEAQCWKLRRFMGEEHAED